VQKVDGSFVRDWLVLGPFPSRDLNTDLLADVGGEANIRPQEGDSVTTKEGKKLTWTRLRSQYDLADVAQVFDGLEWSVVYAYCEVDADEPIDTDARMTSWIPGSFSWNGNAFRPFPVRGHFDLPPTMPIHLNKGRNHGLLKLRFASELPYAFAFQPLPPNRGLATFRVLTPNGQPVSGALIRFYSQGQLAAHLESDTAGNAEACLFPLADSYEVQVTSNGMGTWLSSISLRPGQRQVFEAVLRDAVSISGKTLAMDGSPQSSIVVQALRVEDGTVSNRTDPSRSGFQTGFASGPRVNPLGLDARSRSGGETSAASVVSLVPTPDFSRTVLSDTNGYFQFVNLRPGLYRLRAHGARDFVHPYGDPQEGASDLITVQPGQTNRPVSFVFPVARKGALSKFVVKRSLSEVNPLAVTRTRDGTLWAGTFNNSLHSFDGVKSTEYSSPSGQWGVVLALAEDPSGTLWIGSPKGISRLAQGKVDHLPINDQVPGMTVGKIQADAGGSVWFGTTAGLFRHDQGGFHRWTSKDGLPSNEVGALVRLRDGALWMSTLHSLVRFDGQKFSEPVLLSGTRQVEGDRIYQSKDGAIWFSSRAWERAVHRFDGTNLFRLGENEGLVYRLVNDIAETSDGVIWLATDNGLSSFNGKTVHTYPDLGEVARIYVDADDVLWFSTPSGICRLDPKTFIQVVQKDGVAPQRNGASVYAIEPDKKGGYLLGTEWAGVYRVAGTPLDQVSSTTFPNQFVRRIVHSADGSLWFGATGGIYKQTEGGILKVVERDWIIAMDFDDKGLLWFGHGWNGGGVSNYDPKTGAVAMFTRKDGLQDDYVWAVTKSPSGGVLIGTGVGLTEFRDGHFSDVGAKIGIRPGGVASLGRDPDGSIWVGGDAGGQRLKWNGTNLIASGPIYAPPSESVWCSSRTADGVTWVGTLRSGLLGSDGRATTMLDKRDGLPADSVVSLATDRDDSLLIGFPGTSGILRYKRTKSLPTVHVTAVRLESRSFSQFTELPVTEIGKPVNIQYQEIDLKTHPEKRQFVYRIQDPKGETLFSGITKERQFDWTPRKGGVHTFEVQAIDRDLNYSKPARITIHAVVPWYANAWIIVPGAVGICALLFSSALTGWRYLVHRRELGRLQERARIARDLHDHLGAGLTHLAMVGDMVRQKADRSNDVEILASRLSESARALTRVMGEVIWATDPEKDTLGSLALFISQYAERFFADSTIRLRFDIPENLPELMVPSGHRNSLFMVVKEALNNVAKHAQASELRIKLELSGRELRLTVEDNGRGFSKAKVTPDTHGLINMEKRLTDLGGQLQIQSVEGQGTRIDARLTLPKG